ncbi:DUF1214 domain-containing protein [Haladaptatus sp. AB618]|uniref:DUF1214 domain-containing protein n=1 Tax=Haladaptatus sp. AB618 TaxID=2934173 RepID=UPI00209BF7B4|nr:DUF1214 domain-containing protein [Haladaptatus sp. AB618]MCO8256804.1 DUF1214 domain-containing protein [Haladaptatus sp. AB618]
MDKDTHDNTTETEFKPLQATRRSALQGAGLAGLLAVGVGSASANQDTPSQTTEQAQQQTTDNANAVPVTWANYPRANCHASFQATVDKGGFGQLLNIRNIAPIGEQLDVETNRDTLYSYGVFDLTEPVTITLPDTGDRYQSMNVQNECQYGKMCVTDPGSYTITQELTETRYAGVAIRTFVDPNDPDDVKQVQKLQDEIGVEQASAGSFEIPNWDPQSFKQLDDALTTVFTTLENFSGAYGDVGKVDPVKFFVASPSGWTGVPQPSEALFLQRIPTQNDGTMPYELTVGEDVPVDAFWSVSVYNRDLYFEENEYDAYTINNLTAERNADGSVTIHFGGDPDQPNFIYTPDGWHYIVRLYQPRTPIINGSYQFPEAEPVK